MANLSYFTDGWLKFLLVLIMISRDCDGSKEKKRKLNETLVIGISYSEMQTTEVCMYDIAVKWLRESTEEAFVSTGSKRGGEKYTEVKWCSHY